MKNNYKIVGIVLLIIIALILLPKGFATDINSIYKAEDAEAICQDVISGKLQVGVHSYYNNNDTILESRTTTCNNSTYFTDNIQGKKEGEDYPTYTFFDRSSTYKHYIEGIDVTNADKYKYFFISSRAQQYDATTGEIIRARNLKPGESIFLDIDLSEDNINSSNYNDLRVTFDYGYKDDTNIVLTSSVSYYIIDENDVKYGPYEFSDAEIMKNIHYVKTDNNGNVTADDLLKDYKIVSENLITDSLPANTKIKKIRIVPFEDYPTQSSLFRLYSMSVDSYNPYSNNKEYVSGINSMDVRQNITNNMATNGTIKWGVNSARKLTFYCAICASPKTFSSSHVYYGTPYVYDTRATAYSFMSQTTEDGGIQKYNFATEYKKKEVATNGVEVEGETPSTIYVYEEGNPHTDDISRRTNDLANYSYVQNTSGYLYGQHCSSSVYAALGKELPFAVDENLGSSKYISSGEVRIMEGIEIDYSDLEKELRDRNILTSTDKTTATVLKKYYSDYLKEKYSEEDFYNGYALMVPGDVSCRDLHTRMVTGYAHVECNDGTVTNRYTPYFCQDHGNINPTQSYILETEVHTSHTNMSIHATELPRHVNQEEAGWTMTPDSRFTDITNVDSFYEEGNTNLTSFRFNRKVYFDDLYGRVDGTFDPEFDPESGAYLDDDEEAKTMYLPFRFKALDRIIETGQVEKPRFRFVADQDYNPELLNSKLYSYLSNDHRLRGEIITNYLIDAVKITINNQTYYDYPNQTNNYSLYYDLQNQDAIAALNNLNYTNSNTISVSVLMGPNLQAVKNSLSLDNEGYMNVVTITTPGGKITPTLDIQNSVNVEYEHDATVSYTYNGDGEVSCVSANTNIATCSVNNQNKTITFTSQNIGTVNVTLNASEGEFYTTASTDITVNIVGAQYTISFDANGGTGGQTEDVIATYTQAMPTISTTPPTRTGYTFGGWYDTAASTGGIKYYNSNGTSARNWNKQENATLYARWIADTFTISFHANGGTGGQTENVTATYGAAMPTLKSTSPTRTGYTFGGWYDTFSTIDGTKYYNVDGSSARNWDKTENATLYARWTANNYNVSFNANGGTGGQSENVTATYDATMPAITATPPTKAGYTFIGWFDDASGGVKYYNADGSGAIAWNKTQNATLYAHWEAKTYTISFNVNGGTGGQSESVIATYDSPMPMISATVPTKEGYIFGGWYDTSESTGGNKYYNTNGSSARIWDKEENTTLYARWTSESFTITFNANGGIGGQNESVTATYGASMPDISTTPPTKAGYAFDGWYDNKVDGIKYYTASGSSARTWDKTENTTLYAHWVAKTSTISFNANGGTGGQSANVNATFDSPMPMISLTAPIYSGYVFGGWYDTSESTGGTMYYTADGSSARTWDKEVDTILYARWVPNIFTVSFDSDGGTAITSQIITYGNKAVKPNNPTKEGYIFIEWQLYGTTYDFDTIVDDDITLVAKWEEILNLSDLLTDKGYVVSGNYVSKFTLGTTIQQIQNELGNDVTITTDTSIISTGTIIKKGNERYTVVIKGDLTGDGKINSGDLLQMRKYLLEEVTLTGAYKQAGLIESQNDIKSLDLLRLRQYLLDEYTIS